jgi:hypothetical protein
LKIPIAAMDPNIVETEAAMNAIKNVFTIALTREWCMPPEKSEL